MKIYTTRMGNSLVFSHSSFDDISWVVFSRGRAQVVYPKSKGLLMRQAVAIYANANVVERAAR